MSSTSWTGASPWAANAASGNAQTVGLGALSLSAQTGYTTNAEIDYHFSINDWACGTNGPPEVRHRLLPDCRRQLAGACCLLAAALLAGCSNGPAVNAGPFGGAGNSTVECAPLHPGQVLSYGFLAFPNTGTTTAVVSRISLVSPHRIKVLAAYLIPITGTDLYGVWAGWPPAAHIPPGVQWSQRQRASGAKIPPTHGHQLINILLVLKRVGFVGSVDGLDVYYSAGGNQYLLHTFSKIVVWTWGKPYTCPNPAGP